MTPMFPDAAENRQNPPHPTQATKCAFQVHTLKVLIARRKNSFQSSPMGSEDELANMTRPIFGFV